MRKTYKELILYVIMENKEFKNLSIEEMEEHLETLHEFNKELADNLDLIFNLKI
jgi:ribosomal protein L29